MTQILKLVTLGESPPKILFVVCSLNSQNETIFNVDLYKAIKCLKPVEPT